jgi:hypothetical protein
MSIYSSVLSLGQLFEAFALLACKHRIEFAIMSFMRILAVYEKIRGIGKVLGHLVVI